MSDAVEADRRLHPSTLVIRFLEQAPQFVLGAPVGVYFFAGLGTALLVLFAGFAASIFYAWAYWLRFAYGIGDEQLVIESGIWSRNRRTIPFDRIQDVSIERRLLARLLGVATVRIETGSSGSDEGTLDCIGRDEAGRLRDLVRRHRAGMRAAESAAPDDRPGASPLFAMDSGRLLVAGLFQFSFVFLAAIGAAWQFLAQFLPGRYFNPANWPEDGSTAVIGLISFTGIAAILVALLLLAMVSGIVRSFVRDYGFRVTPTETGLRRERGLFTRTDVVIPLRRIQAAIVSTGLVRRLFGWQSLALQSLGADGDAGTHHIVAPFARRAELEPIADEIGLPLPPDPAAFHRVSPRAIPAAWIRLGVLLCVVVLAASLAWRPAPWLLIALPLLATFAIVRHRAHGYLLEQGRLFVRRGVWEPRIVILDRARIQSATIRRGPLQSALGLATLVFGTAGAARARPLEIVDLSAAMARRLVNAALDPIAVMRAD